jgi:glycosyltransferase involved in cell wall biosynthesis
VTVGFTVICPVHNEEAVLPSTIDSIFNLEPNEIIFGLDRCSDRSEDIILAASRRRKYQNKGTLILRKFTDKDGVGWSFRPAYLRRELYRLAENDTILNTSADIRLCPSIRRHLSLIPGHGIVSFHYYEYPWTIQCFERALLNRFRQGFAGLLAFSRRAWLETEDLEDLKIISRAEDTHLQLAIKRSYPVTHIHTHSLHLRPNESPRDHYYRGVAQWRMLRRPGWMVFLHSLFMLRPSVLTGWRHAQRWSIIP